MYVYRDLCFLCTEVERIRWADRQIKTDVHSEELAMLLFGVG